MTPRPPREPRRGRSLRKQGEHGEDRGPPVNKDGGTGMEAQPDTQEETTRMSVHSPHRRDVYEQRRQAAR